MTWLKIITLSALGNIWITPEREKIFILIQAGCYFVRPFAEIAIPFFLEQQWMPLVGWRGNCRDWVIVAKWCWYWISKHKKEYCGAISKKLWCQKKVFAMPMLMSRFPNDLVTALYFVKRYWGLSILLICSKMIVHLILDFMILFKLR